MQATYTCPQPTAARRGPAPGQAERPQRDEQGSAGAAGPGAAREPRSLGAGLPRSGGVSGVGRTQEEAARTVRQMMAGPAGGSGGGDPQQQRKLLWGGGSRAAAAAPANQAGAAAPAGGANRWDAAEFGSEDQKAKFLKLMGGHRAAAAAPQPRGQGAAAPEGGAPAAGGAGPGIMRRDVQQEVLGTLESQFRAGVGRRMGGGRTGLGL